MEKPFSVAAAAICGFVVSFLVCSFDFWLIVAFAKDELAHRPASFHVWMDFSILILIFALCMTGMVTALALDSLKDWARRIAVFPFPLSCGVLFLIVVLTFAVVSKPPPSDALFVVGPGVDFAIFGFLLLPLLVVGIMWTAQFRRKAVRDLFLPPK